MWNEKEMVQCFIRENTLKFEKTIRKSFCVLAVANLSTILILVLVSSDKPFLLEYICLSMMYFY